MFKLLTISLLTGVLLSCGGGESKKAPVENINLEKFKDRLSYVMGAEHSKVITNSGDPNLALLDYNAIIDGFKNGLKNPKQMTPDCVATIQGLYGPNGQDFDTTYLEKGCNCIGNSVGTVFMDKWTKTVGEDKFDFDKVVIGFQHGLEARDTLISKIERDEIFSNFKQDLSSLLITENKALEVTFLAEAKERANSKTLDNGIVIEVIEEGTGASPKANSDVVADYILTNAKGDTMESSFEYKIQRGGESPAFNLGGVIPGWTQGFQHLKKGGKYRLFIPGELAYGVRSNFEPLCFYIEFIDFGEKGTLVKPRPAQTGF